MVNKLRLIFKRPFNPEFKPSGIALDYIQFAMFNVVGAGAKTKQRAVINWVKQAIKIVKE